MWWVLPARIMWATMGWRSIIMIFSAALTAGIRLYERRFQSGADTKAAVDGYNLVTTLDANIQGIVERKLQEYNDTYKNAAREGNGAQNVGCIIMDVNNGDILAMASYPFFNLNDPSNTDMLLGRHVVNEQEQFRIL